MEKKQDEEDSTFSQLFLSLCACVRVCVCVRVASPYVH